MPGIYYLSKGQLCSCIGGKVKRIKCGAVEQYLQTIKSIQRRNEWKTEGSGARFMQVASSQRDISHIYTDVEAICAVDSEKLIYAASLESSCAVCSKNPDLPMESEGYIVRKANTRFYHLDYDSVEQLIVASVSDGYEKHLALCHEKSSDFRTVTEGQSVDVMPSFSKANNKVVYFSSAGLYVDEESYSVHYSNFSLCKLDMVSNELIEVLSDEKYDYLYPRETEKGSLYCIRRKKQPTHKGMTIQDIILMPGKFFSAVFGWLNFFTQRYSGESLLKSGGTNPVKNKKRSEHEIFIEGNLINVDKTLRENKLQGEKYPGIAPGNWELILVNPGSQAEVIRKGVLDYALETDGSIIYSNGKYIIRKTVSGDEVILCEAELAKNICMLNAL